MNKITREDVEGFAFLCEMDDWDGGNTLNIYQELATKSAFYPGKGSALGLAYVGLKLNGEAGEFAEHVGKAMRDDGYGDLELTDERHALIVKEIGDVLWYLSAACNELDISLSDAAYANLDKLCSRTERGVLKGSGDER